MRAVILTRFADPADALTVGEMDVPVLKRGQVLVKIAAAPINPADSAFIRGFYARKPLPTVPGLEGTGTVVEANADNLDMLRSFMPTTLGRVLSMPVFGKDGNERASQDAHSRPCW